MFYVNDDFYDQSYINQCFDYFDDHEVIFRCAEERFTVCIHDAALWIALCLYIKAKGGSVFPLPIETSIPAARARAEKSQSQYLLLSDEEGKIEVEKVNGTEPNRKGVLVQMSSGTTGDPKIIERTWDSIETEMNAYVEHFPEANEMTPVIAAPVSHSYGLICGVLIALKRNVTPVVITNLNPKYILRKLEEVDLPILYSSPALISTITMLSKSEMPIHAIMTSGILMKALWFQKVKSKTVHLYQQYGCSEAGCIALGKDVESFDEIGKPLPHLRVTSGASKDKPSEIIVNSEKEGFVYTKDLAYFDEGGNLHFVSRVDDMINVSGLNVYPGEVEEAVLSMPPIEDAVVFKKSHSLGSEQVCLNFVSQTRILPEHIRQWCREQLAEYQVPMHINQVEKIDKLPNGKVNRKKLAEAV